MSSKIVKLLVIVLLVYIGLKLVEIERYRRESFAGVLQVTPYIDRENCLDFSVLIDNWKPILTKWTKIEPSVPFENLDQIISTVRSFDLIARTKTKPYTVYVMEQTDSGYGTALEDDQGQPDTNWAVYTTYNKCAFSSGKYNIPSVVYRPNEQITFNDFNMPFYQYRSGWLVDNLVEMEPTGTNTFDYWVGQIANDPSIDVLCYKDTENPVYIGSTLAPDIFIEAGTESTPEFEGDGVYNTYVRTQTGAYVPPVLPTGPGGKWALYKNKVAIPYYVRKEFLAIDVFDRKVATVNEWFRWAAINQYDMINFPTNFLGEPIKTSSVVWVGRLEEINATYSSVGGYQQSLEPALDMVAASPFFGPFNGGLVRVNEQGQLECATSPGSSGCLNTFPSLNPVNITKLANTIKNKGDAGDSTIPYEPNQFLQDIQANPTLAVQSISTPTDVSNVNINPDGSITIPQPIYDPKGLENTTQNISDQATVVGKISEVVGSLGKKKTLGVFDRQGLPVDINRITVSESEMETAECEKECKDTTSSSGRTIRTCKYKNPACSGSLPWMKYLLQNNQFADKMGLFVFIRDLSVWSYVPIVSQSNPSKCIGQSSNGPLSAQLLNCDPSMMWSGTADGQLKIAGTDVALTNALDASGIDTDVRPALTDKLEPGNPLQKWIIDGKGRIHSMTNLNQCLTNTSGFPLNSALASNDQAYRQNFIQNRVHVSACVESKYDQQRWVAGIKLPIEPPIREDKGKWTRTVVTTSYSTIPYANMTKVANNDAFYSDKDADYYSTPTRITQLLNLGSASQYYAYAPLASWQAWARENGYDVLALPRKYGQPADSAKEAFVGILSNINNDIKTETILLDHLGKAVIGAIDAYKDVKNYFQNSFVRDLQCAFSWLPGVSCPDNSPKGYAAVIDRGGWDVYIFQRELPIYNATLRTEEAPNKCLTNDGGRLNMQNCNSYNTAQQWSSIDGQLVNRKDPTVKTPKMFIDSQHGFHRQDDVTSCFGIGSAISNLKPALTASDILAINPSQSAAIQSDLQKYNITSLLNNPNSGEINLASILAQMSTGPNVNYLNMNTYDFNDRQVCDVLGLWGRMSADPDKDPPRPNMNDWGERQRWIIKNTPSSWSDLQAGYYANYLPDMQTQLSSETAKYAQLQTNFRSQQASCDFAKRNASTGDYLPVCESARRLEILTEQSKQNVNSMKTSINSFFRINEMVNDQKMFTESPDRQLLCNGIKAASNSWFKTTQFVPEKYLKLFEKNYCDELFQVDTVTNICQGMKQKYNLTSNTSKPLEFPYTDIWDELKCKENTFLFPVDCQLDVSPTISSCEQSPNGNFSPQRKITVRQNDKNGGRTCNRVMIEQHKMKNPIISSTDRYNEFNVIERDGTYSSLDSCIASLTR